MGEIVDRRARADLRHFQARFLNVANLPVLDQKSLHLIGPHWHIGRNIKIDLEEMIIEENNLPRRCWEKPPDLFAADQSVLEDFQFFRTYIFIRRLKAK